MIPKIIHYCWFGGKELPDDLKEYINSWKEKCPDYQLIRWDESNFDYTKYRYSNEAYDHEKWAFVSDVARLYAVYNYGGIYLDTDVEVLKSFNDLLHLKGFIGAEDKYDLNTGACFGAEKHSKVVLENLNEYRNLQLFYGDKMVKTTCVEVTTRVFSRYGYKNAKFVSQVAGFTVFPQDFFSPLKLSNNKLNITNNTYSVHYYTTNWKKRNNIKKIFLRRTVFIKKNLRRQVERFFGEGSYQKLKKLL